MRGKSNLASLMLAAISVAGASMLEPLSPLAKVGSNHRRVAPRPTGALKIRRAARKARNRKANRG